MAVHDKLAATALRLIAKHGRDVTLYKTSRTPQDSAKPWEGPGVGFADSVTCRAVLTDYVEEEIDGSIVLRGDKKLLVSALAVAGRDLSKFSKVDDGGNVYGFVKVDVIRPGTTVVLYTIQVRG